MEDILRAVALGVVQGLTEFLPISSSGHLIVTRELFGWEFADDLTFDVALHLGTTVAVIAFFWSEWLAMLRSGLQWLRQRGEPVGAESSYNSRLLVLLAIGSVPAGVTGVVLDVFLEDDLRSPIVVGVMLMVFGAVLFLAERLSRGKREVGSTQVRDAALVGAAQAVSLIPGVSRSGITISAAMARGFSRAEGARLSFLLATPAILGAGILKCGEAAVEGVPSEDIGAIVVGAAVSAVVGWLSIRYLLRLVQTGTFAQFIIYRLVAGAFIVVYFSV